MVELEKYIFCVGCEQCGKICVPCIGCRNVDCAMCEVELCYKGDSEYCILGCALCIVICVCSVYV